MDEWAQARNLGFKRGIEVVAGLWSGTDFGGACDPIVIPDEPRLRRRVEAKPLG